MATIEDVKQDIADLSAKADLASTGLDAVIAAIAALKAQVAAGSAVSQADIDSLHDSTVAVKDKLDAVKTKEDQAVS